jgi:Xaa-Pro dipeptidase
MRDDLGTMALDERSRIDFDSMRRERFLRVTAEMVRDGLDALILGREANARYVSGARRLWTVGARPFGPGCIVVRGTGQVHLLSTWDDGIPDAIANENLYPMSWSPENVMASLGRIEGLAEARRIGVDGMTPLFARLLADAYPNAEWVNGATALERARLRKTPEEIQCLRTAAALAEGAFAAMASDVRPGVSERELIGRYSAEAAVLGATIPAFEAGFCATAKHGTDTGPPTVRLAGLPRILADGDLVTCHAGVMYAGYEGAIGTTLVCGGMRNPDTQDLAIRLERLRGAIHGACRPKARLSDLHEAWADCGEPLPSLPIYHGMGLGFEPPIAARLEAGLPIPPSDARLEAGMVIATYAYVHRDGVGGCFARDTVHVGDERCEFLSRPLGSYAP